MKTTQHARAYFLRSPANAAQQRRLSEPLFKLQFLATPDKRIAIAELRKFAPMGVEEDLGAGLMPYEQLRDDIGVVTALYRSDKLVATMRFVPCGQRLTAAERLDHSIPSGVTGPGSWEVGRLIIAPDERSPELLHRCLALSLHALANRYEIARFYAIANSPMARLWRRFGMRSVATLTAASGKEFHLVAGALADVADALDVAPTLPRIRRELVDIGPQFDTLVPAEGRIPSAEIAFRAAAT